MFGRLHSLSREIRRAHRAGREPQAPGDQTGLPNPEDLLAGKLVIPVNEETGEERERSEHHDRGLFLARQDRWDELGQAIRRADQARMATSGGMPVADLLAAGARADAVETGPLGHDRDPLAVGLDQFEGVLEEFTGDYGVALIVALAHIDAGWAFRGNEWSDQTRKGERDFREQFERAGRILDDFDPFQLNSPALAAARCALLPGLERPAERVADDYEDLIDLDPANPMHMRTFGRHMLPRWFGGYEQLEAQARRTSERTRDIWGSGGYVWTYFDALATDFRALAFVDCELFLDGLTDILVTRSDQHTTNLLAAFTGGLMAPDPDMPATRPEVETNRAKLHGAFGWILRTHLREVHPLVWADVLGRFRPDGEENGGGDRDSSVKLGQTSAMSSIARQFETQIANGTRVTISRDGIDFEPAA